MANPYLYGLAAGQAARRRRDAEEAERERERVEDELDRLRFERDMEMMDAPASKSVFKKRR
jgi:hypothetical protein